MSKLGWLALTLLAVTHVGSYDEKNLRLREYVPIGEMIPGMAYLVRRLLENTSNESWLKAGFLDDASEAELLKPPLAASQTDSGNSQAIKHALSDAPLGIADDQPFFTEPVRDWSDQRQRDAFASDRSKAKVPAVANDSTVEQAADAVLDVRAH